MLLKLIKYDLRSGFSKYLSMYVGLAAMIFINAVIRLINLDILYGPILFLSLLGSVAFVLMFAVVSVMHFYGEMCGKRSYLNYTLPVDGASLYWSKIISVTVWTILSVTALVLFWISCDFCVLRPIGMPIRDIIRSITDSASESGFPMLSFVAMLIVQFVTYMFVYGFFILLSTAPQIKNKGMGLGVSIVGAIFTPQITGILVLAIMFFIASAKGSIQAVISNDITAITGLVNPLVLVYFIVCCILSVTLAALSIRIVRNRHSL